MFDTQRSKRQEHDRSQTDSAQETSRTKRSTQHTADFTRIPLYAQAGGNLPPAWLRLPTSSPGGERTVQRQVEEGVGQKQLTSPQQTSPLQSDEAASGERIEQNATDAEGPWSKLREEFQVGSESHSLYFLHEHGQLVLVINPKLQYLKDFLDALKKYIFEQGEESSSTIVSSYEELTIMVKSVQKEANRKKPDFPQITSALRRIAKRLTQVGTATQIHGIARPPSHILFLPKREGSNEYGNVTSAIILSVDPGDSPGGSPPLERSIWGYIHTRHPAFVRGHLLNKHLHGPGTANNLTPITDYVNRKMSEKVEEPLKEEVLQRNRVYWYLVIAQYEGHPPQEGYTEWEREVIPTKIVCQWERYSKKPGYSGANASDWERNKQPDKWEISQKLPPSEQQLPRQRSLRENELLARFLADPDKKPSESSKLEKRAFSQVQSGQITLEQAFKRQKVEREREQIRKLEEAEAQSMVIDEIITETVNFFLESVRISTTSDPTQEEEDESIIKEAQERAEDYYRQLCEERGIVEPLVSQIWQDIVFEELQ